MEQRLFAIKNYPYQFRIGKLNALDILAFRTQINFDNIDSAKNVFSNILENIEVQIGEKWLPCKVKDQAIFYPAEIEDNVDLLNEVVGYFLNDFLKPVFRKSNE